MVRITINGDEWNVEADPDIDLCGKISGPWKGSTASDSFIQWTLNTALIQLAETLGVDGEAVGREEISLVLTEVQARDIASSHEFRCYCNRGGCYCMAELTSPENPNRRYGLTSFLYGLRVVVKPDVLILLDEAKLVPDEVLSDEPVPYIARG